MPDHDPIRSDRDAPIEPGPQPDPMLTEGQPGPWRKWAITFGIVAVVLLVMYGLTAHRETEQNKPAIVGSNNTQPSQPLPGGRGTSDAPNSPPVTTPR